MRRSRRVEYMAHRAAVGDEAERMDHHSRNTVQVPGGTQPIKSHTRSNTTHMHTHLNSALIDSSLVLWCFRCADVRHMTFTRAVFSFLSDPIRVKMLCGADLLESTLVPGLWSREDVRTTHTARHASERARSRERKRDRPCGRTFL